MPAEDPPAREAVQQQIDGIRILPGKTNVLIVAPHGAFQTLKNGKRKYRNDFRTGLIAEAIHKHKDAGWFTIINDAFIKPDEDKNEEPDFKAKRLDLFKIEQAKLVPGYLEAIKSAVDAHEGKTLVVWVHGMSDKSARDEKAEHIKAGKMKKGDGDLHALIGYGQGAQPRLKAIKEPKDEDKTKRYTADTFTVERFRDELTALGLFTLIARDEAPNFRGRDPERLNQWFRNQNQEYSKDKVQSIQIEIREKGFRETPEQCVETAKVLVEALRKIAPPAPSKALEPEILDAPVTEGGDNLPVPTGQKEATPEPLVPEIVDEQSEDELVEETYAWLQSRLKEHIIDFTVEAGHRIINAFYGGDYEKARLKKKVKGKALRKLIQKLQSQASNAPSKTWVYDAVNLAVDDHSYGGDENFRAHGNLGPIQAYRALGHNQRLRLAYVKDPEIKEKLITETADHNYNDRDLRKRIAEEKRKLAGKAPKSLPQPKDLPPLDLDHLPAKAVLRKQDPENLRALFDLVKSKIDEGQKDFRKYRRALYNLGLVLAEKTGDFIEGEGRFQEWTKENINICSGCKNDCLYCYMKPMGVRNPHITHPNDWRNWELDQKKVDTERKLYDGRVGFPSSHDIFPEILDAYLEVLGKVLRAGNDVLIVSKPRLDCIEAICSACVFFKDKILFRFTIGANDNEILRYWEPNAPTYEERKDCLAYARDNGFRTSVSVEPMLDTQRIEQMVKDLDPMVNEFIWLGMMSHVGRLKNWSNVEGFEDRKKIIEAGQTPEMLAAIYDAFRDNPKVKFKTETLKVIFEHLKQIGRIKGDMTVEAGKLVPAERQ